MLNNFGATETPSFKTCTTNKTSLSANVAKEIIPVNDNRMFALFQNPSGVSITLVLGETTGATVGKGIVLLPYGSFEITRDNLYTGKISAISSSAAELVYVECVK